MAGLSDYPAEKVRDFVRGILDRNAPRDGVSWTVQLHMDVDQARMLWAAGRYVEILETMGKVELTDFSCANIRKYLGELLASRGTIDGYEAVEIVEISRRGLAILGDCEKHLDQFAIISAAPSRPKPQSGKGKRR